MDGHSIDLRGLRNLSGLGCAPPDPWDSGSRASLRYDLYLEPPGQLVDVSRTQHATKIVQLRQRVIGHRNSAALAARLVIDHNLHSGRR